MDGRMSFGRLSGRIKLRIEDEKGLVGVGGLCGDGGL